jgi:DNA mismatch endonuclease, patch repair protein
MVFTRIRLAVFLDGCYWHGCPEHFARPKTNADYWAGKIAGNRSRDADTDRKLRAEGWRVIRVWEHEDPAQAALGVEAAVLALRGSQI